MNIRTRFAPSPTGHMHLGGIRTALFNWLFARKHNGQFVLRIDDTDRGRHQEETIQPILDAFEWLGLDFDEGPEVGGPHVPYFQSRRTEIYKAWVNRLLEADLAYKDYASASERNVLHKQAVADRRTYITRELFFTRSQISDREAAGEYCVRLRIEPDNLVTLNDLVRGEVSWNTTDFGDFAISRSDGSVLYSLATVVDDATMSISHVIRSEEHLTNTCPQILLYQAMGFNPPAFAHLPYVAMTGTKRKMSKRDAGGTLDEYFGNYLPDAVLNYLARLGWSFDGHTEIFTRDELISNFSLERVVKSPASHDLDKLYWTQSEWMKNTNVETKVQGAALALIDAGLITKPFSDVDMARIKDVVIALGDRMKTFRDFVRVGGFFFKPMDFDLEAVKKRLLKNEDQTYKIISDLRKVFDSLENWSLEALESVVREYGGATNMGIVVNALRVSITGVGVGPGLYEALVILGKDDVLNRLGTTIDAWDHKTGVFAS